MSESSLTAHDEACDKQVIIAGGSYVRVAGTMTASVNATLRPPLVAVRTLVTPVPLVQINQCMTAVTVEGDDDANW